MKIPGGIIENLSQHDENLWNVLQDITTKKKILKVKELYNISCN
jgi:hypothetical protein